MVRHEKGRPTWGGRDEESDMRAKERQMNAKCWESLDFISRRHGILVKEVCLPNLEHWTRVIPEHS
jgi:hypothetical protein